MIACVCLPSPHITAECIAIRKTEDAKLHGVFNVNQLDIPALAALLLQRSPLSGRLTAKPAISANTAGLGQLSAVLGVETPFQVHKACCAARNASAISKWRRARCPLTAM